MSARTPHDILAEWKYCNADCAESPAVRHSTPCAQLTAMFKSCPQGRVGPVGVQIIPPENDATETPPKLTSSGESGSRDSRRDGTFNGAAPQGGKRP